MTGFELDHYNGVPVARITVDVDSASAARLRDQLIACVPHGTPTLIVDLSSTRYLDSAGIDMLFRLNQRLAQRRGSLRLVIPPSSQLTRLADIVALPSAVQVHPDIDDAVESATRPAGRSVELQSECDG